MAASMQIIPLENKIAISSSLIYIYEKIIKANLLSFDSKANLFFYNHQ